MACKMRQAGCAELAAPCCQQMCNTVPWLLEPNICGSSTSSHQPPSLNGQLEVVHGRVVQQLQQQAALAAQHTPLLIIQPRRLGSALQAMGGWVGGACKLPNCHVSEQTYISSGC